MRVTKVAEAKWQEVTLPGKIEGVIRAYSHDVPREETDMNLTTVEMPNGAQALWHSHPRGQLLVAISGLGQIQVQGDDVVELQPGDSIWAPLASGTPTVRRPATTSPSLRSSPWTRPPARSSTGEHQICVTGYCWRTSWWLSCR